MNARRNLHQIHARERGRIFFFPETDRPYGDRCALFSDDAALWVVRPFRMKKKISGVSAAKTTNSYTTTTTSEQERRKRRKKKVKISLNNNDDEKAKKEIEEK